MEQRLEAPALTDLELYQLAARIAAHRTTGDERTSWNKAVEAADLEQLLRVVARFDSIETTGTDFAALRDQVYGEIQSRIVAKQIAASERMPPAMYRGRVLQRWSLLRALLVLSWLTAIYVGWARFGRFRGPFLLALGGILFLATHSHWNNQIMVRVAEQQLGKATLMYAGAYFGSGLAVSIAYGAGRLARSLF